PQQPTTENATGNNVPTTTLRRRLQRPQQRPVTDTDVESRPTGMATADVRLQHR
ncbi:Hypothetical protein CINCED_3A007517, partial [Cinara cedri]